MRKPQRDMLLGVLCLAMVTFLIGCSDEEEVDLSMPEISAPAPLPSASGTAGKKEKDGEGDTSGKSPEKDEKVLTDAEFVGSPENRDPFRVYTTEFLTTSRRQVKIQRKVFLQRYGLDELRLIAVVTGEIRPRAMFRDPSGLGVTVRRGDYVGKSAGKVKQILGDKVILQIEEQFEGGQKMADRVIELHAKGKAGSGSRSL